MWLPRELAYQLFLQRPPPHFLENQLNWRSGYSHFSEKMGSEYAMVSRAIPATLPGAVA